MPVRLVVDCDVLSSPKSGVAVYLNEVLHRLPTKQLVLECRPDVTKQVAPGKKAHARQLLRRAPYAYDARRIYAGWPRVGRDAVYWAPNFLAPPWPLMPARTVITVHDLIFWQHPDWADARRGRFLRHHLPAVVKACRRVIVPSDETGHELIRLIPSARDKTRTIHHGIRELAVAALAAKPEVPLRHILCLGNIEKRKDTLTAVLAHRLLPPERRRQYPLLIVGQSLNDAYSHAVYTAADPPFVKIIGRATDPELAVFMTQAAALVAPSLAEGFGLVPLEAVAGGVPVVAADLPLTRELLGSSVAYFPATDHLALAVELTKLLNSGLRPSLDQRRELSMRYSWQRSADEHAALFQEVAAETL